MGSWYRGKYAIVTLECLGCVAGICWNSFITPKNVYSFRKQQKSWHFPQEKEEFIWNHHVCHHAGLLTTIITGCWTHPGGYSTFPTLDAKSMHQNICTGTTSSHMFFWWIFGLSYISPLSHEGLSCAANQTKRSAVAQDRIGIFLFDVNVGDVPGKPPLNTQTLQCFLLVSWLALKLQMSR